MIHTGFKHQEDMDCFKLILREGTKRGYGAHLYYSHMTRNFCCEVRQLHQRFKGGSGIYYVTAGHKYADSPLEALVLAFRQCVPHSPYLAALYLEAEWMLLLEARDKSIKLEYKLTAALDTLDDLLTTAHQQVEAAIYQPKTLFERMQDIVNSRPEPEKAIIPNDAVAKTIKPLFVEDDDL